MADDRILRTYGDVSRKEDVVLNAIELLTAQETQVMNMLGKTAAKDTVHSYLVDTLRTAGSNAVAEAADFTASANSTPTRLTNLVEEVAINFKVSKVQQDVEHYHGENELNRQTNKALKDWANSVEFDLIRSTLVSGVSGTVPKMAGIIAAISKSTNYTSHTSAVVFNTSHLDGLMKANWENSNGDVATDLLLGPHLRRKMDEATAKSNIVVNGSQTAIVRTVSTYTTAFGTLNVRTHRYIQQGGDATARILAIRPEKLRIAYLSKPTIMTDLQKGGAYDNYAVYGSLTLEVRNQDSNFFADGFHLTS